MPKPTPETHPNIYEIRIKGHLDTRRLSAFAELTFTHHPNGEMTFTGPILDQSALYGILNRLRDLGVPLLAVNRINNITTTKIS